MSNAFITEDNTDIYKSTSSYQPGEFVVHGHTSSDENKKLKLTILYTSRSN